MSSLQAFDPERHILVVRDKDTGRHVHVAWRDVLVQLSAAPAPIQVAAPAVDLTPLLRRLEALEGLPRADSMAGAVSDAAAQLAGIAHRITALERRHDTHEHHYNLTAQQVESIVAAVVAQMRVAA